MNHNILVSLNNFRIGLSVLKPVEGVAYQKLSPAAGKQAAVVQDHHKTRFLEATDRILHVKSLCEDLHFKPNSSDKFEAAIREVGILIGFGSQRPEKIYDKGPDNLWAFNSGEFLIIECKNEATSTQGISKHDLGQLSQAIDWFEEKYTTAIPKTPVIIHPLKNIGPGAAIVDSARVITEKNLSKLRKSPEDFAKALGDANILGDTSRVAQLLTSHNFTNNTFVQGYTVPLKG